MRPKSCGLDKSSPYKQVNCPQIRRYNSSVKETTDNHGKGRQKTVSVEALTAQKGGNCRQMRESDGSLPFGV